MNKDEFKINTQVIMAVFLCLAIVGLVVANRRADSGTKGEELNQIKREEQNPVLKTNPGGFLGEKGETLQAEGDKVYIDQAKVDDGNLHAFNCYSAKVGKTIYFFIVKASDGTYRAAANACEVCFGSQKGFRQVGNQIRCENCRVTYSKDQIALEKGGCNPRPIDRDVKVIAGRLAINLADIEKTADLF